MDESPKIAQEQTQEKQCRKCQEVKPVEQFSTDRRQGDGRKSWCRACIAAAAREWRARRREERKARANA